jgi:sodium/bile acid cotransporter 7
VVLLMKGGTGQPVFSMSSAQTIVLQLLLPFVVGHLARPWIGAWVSAHKRVLSMTDRSSILLVVYSAFSAAVANGLWDRLPAPQLALTFACCAVLLMFVLVSTWAIGRVLGLEREDAIVLQFCGSKKSLATGVPIASVLFPPAAVGMIIFPLMMFHQMQLIACAVLARRYADDGGQAGAAAGDQGGGKMP